MKTNEEYRRIWQKLYDCENEVALADLKVRKLEQQNLELLAVIEVKDAAIGGMFGPTRDLRSDRFDILSHALLATPSTDLLAKRDQRRDAALLREVAGIAYSEQSYKTIRQLADKRESGEWKPELEVK